MEILVASNAISSIEIDGLLRILSEETKQEQMWYKPENPLDITIISIRKRHTNMWDNKVHS